MKNLTNSFLPLFDTAINYSQVLVEQAKGITSVKEADLNRLKQDILDNLDGIAEAVKQVAESQVAHSLWLFPSLKKFYFK
ncbi:hypothetical protein [Mucilaginibacter sp. 3215]|uniref:hypothetical protein n=2 Tax=unclassified Mucilaginibacter TaxID=2617802 RepID=UPI003D1A8931